MRVSINYAAFRDALAIARVGNPPQDGILPHTR